MYKLGKHPKKFNRFTLAFKDYLSTDIAPAPATVGWYQKVLSWPMYLNDTLGDCVFACGGHMLEAWSANAQTEVSPSDNDILLAYETVGHYVPGNDDTDNGAAITDFLAWWQANPLTSSKKIAAWAEIDQTNLDEVKQAIYIFGGIDIGIQLPQSAMTQFNAGQSWELVNGSSILGGHSVCVLGYDMYGVYLVTWGKVVFASWAFFSQYCDEAYAIISQDFINAQGESPSGFNLASLQTDLAALKN